MTILSPDSSTNFPLLWNVAKLFVISIVAEILFTILFIIIFSVYFQEDFSPYLSEITIFTAFFTVLVIVRQIKKDFNKYGAVQFACIGFKKAKYSTVSIIIYVIIVTIIFETVQILINYLITGDVFLARRDNSLPVKYVKTQMLGEFLFLFHVIIMAPIIEEIIFRGYFQSFLLKKYPLWIALIVPSAIFAFIHFDLYAAPQLFVAGLCLASIRFIYKSLWPAILFHFFHNLIITCDIYFFSHSGL